MAGTKGKWHINDNQEAGKCNAETAEGCPFGTHFETRREARAAIEEKNKDRNIPTVKNNRGRMSDEKFNQTFDTVAEITSLINSKIDSDKKFKETAEFFELVQQRRKYHFAYLYERSEREKELPAAIQQMMASERRKRETVSQVRKEEAPQRAHSFYHPKINKRTHKAAAGITSSLTGLSNDEVDSIITEKMKNGLSLDEAHRELFAETPLRTDKPFMSIDLETSSLREPWNQGDALENREKFFDNGLDTNIIEVGYTVRNPDGTSYDSSELYDVEKGLKEVAGTGSENVHNISLDDVKGKPTFIDATDAHKNLLEKMKSSVVVAHNARFEINQFQHSLPGFAEAYGRGEIEVLDSMNLCKYFVPEAKNNKNGSFVEATGGKYESAHRALADAKMTFNAILRLKGEKELD